MTQHKITGGWRKLVTSGKETVWVVTQYTACYWPKSGKPIYHFELAGVYHTEAEAVKACRDENYLVGPVPVGRPAPHRRAPWPGAYYPLGKTQTARLATERLGGQRKRHLHSNDNRR